MAKELTAVISLAGKVDRSLDAAFTSVNKKVNSLKQSFDTKMVDRFGATTYKRMKGVAIGVAAATAVTVKAGQAAYKLGGQFDEAYDAIRVGTGATGKALKGLEGDFKAVYGSVPTSMGDAATAISDYNTRLGYTGKSLQEVSKQAIAVSKMTGENLSGTIESTSKAFQAWGISAKNSGSAMDYLWKVNQTTGIGFNKLTQSVTKSAPAFQQMGFSFKQSTALIGQLDKAGVDSSKAIGALTKATTGWAKSGMSAQEGLKKTVTQIKNAKNAQEGLSIAAETFGSKAGPQMYKAIRDGTFDIQNFQKQMDASSETILKAELETARDFPEMAQIMKQNFQLALEPLGTAVFSGMAEIGPKMVTIVQKLAPMVANAFTALVPVITTVFDTIADVIEQLGPSLIDTIMAVCNLIVAIFKALSPILPSIIKLIGSVLTVLSPIISLLAQLIQIILPPIVSILSHVISLVNGIMTVALKIVGGILKFIVKALETIKQVVHDVWDGIKNFLSGIWEGIKTVATTVWDAIKNAVTGPVQAAENILSTIWTNIKNFATAVWSAIVGAATSLWNSIKSAMTAPINAAKGVLSNIWNAIKGIASRVWNGIKSAIVTPMTAAKSAIVKIASTIKNALTKAFNAIKNTIGKVIDKVKKLIDWLGKLGHKHASPKVSIQQTGGGGKGKAKGKAKGGFTNGITIAGEDKRYPVEAVISFNPAYRDANIRYWEQAGEMLGMRYSSIQASTLPKVEQTAKKQTTTTTAKTGQIAKAQKSISSAAKSMAQNTARPITPNTTISTYDTRVNPTNSVNVGGVTFAPQISVNGASNPEETRESVLKQLRELEPEFVDFVMDAIKREAEGVYTSGAVY